MMPLSAQNYETMQKHIGERNEVLKEM